MKKLKQFEKQGVFDPQWFLGGPCKIDYDLYIHIICAYIPASYGDGVTAQAGEADRIVNNTYFYMTVCRNNVGYWYLGVLPEF